MTHAPEQPSSPIPPTNSLALGDSTPSDIEQMNENVNQLEFEWENRLGKGTFAQADEMATWYLGKLNDLDSMEAQIKAQAAAMIRAVDARRKALAWRWGGPFREIIDAKLQSQGGKKKSVRLLTGTAGYRTKPATFQVVNDREVLEWAAFNCPEAIRNTVKITPIKDYIKQTGEEVPGIRHEPAREAFFPPITSHELSHPTSPLLESE